MPQKEVKVKVATETELSDVEALEVTIGKLKKQRIQIAIDMASQKLEETRSKIEKLKQEKANLEVGVDDAKIYELDSKIRQLEANEIDLKIELESSKVEQAKSEVDKLDDTSIDLDVNNISAMESIDQIGQGFDRLKAGASEVGQQMSELLTSAGKQETNKAFLEHAVGAERAAKATEDINTAVQKLPGDDTVMQGLLSQAVAKDATLTAGALNDMGVAAADYFSAMSFYGKSATEAQQDMTNYLLAGNTAELERSPILSSHIDKLKEGTTVQERAKLLQEALNEEHWGGMSQQDTYNNKLETFNAMLERGRYNLGGMFQEGAKGGMDFLMMLDESTNGLVGMSLALASFASPITDIFMGIGQIGAGLSTLKDAGDFIGLGQKLGTLKSTLIDVGGAAKTAGLEFLTAGKNALTAGLSALRSAGMWAIQKIQVIASAIANGVLTASQWLLNIAMSMNPIMIVVMAIIALIAVLAYLYFNNEQVRAAIDGLWQSMVQLGQFIYTGLVGAIEWLTAALEGFWNYITTLGGLLWNAVVTTITNIITGIIGFIVWWYTLPGRIAMVIIQIISQIISFASQFVSNLLNAGINGVNNFMSNISQLPGKLWNELQNMLSAVGQWAATLPQKFWDAGVNAVKNFLSALGIASPGTMQRMLIWEISEMSRRVPDKAKDVVKGVSVLGKDIVDSFGDDHLTKDLSYDVTANAMMEKLNTLLKSRGKDIVFNLYGDMDDETRMNKFVDAVIRRLSFENETAGRTV